MTASGRSHTKWQALVAPGFLLLLCVFFSALRWLKMESFWGDSPRWMFEAWRAAQGEIPYRDFAWQYPPLSLLLFGAALHWFGPTFAVIQTVIDLISAAVVLAEFRLARRLVGDRTALLVAVVLACAGASNTGNFALFSLQLYTPAILVGMLGLLLMLDPLLGFVLSGDFEHGGRIWLAAGATIALLSKPEFIMGAAGALGAAAVLDYRRSRIVRQPAAVWIQRQLSIGLAAVAPAALFYALYASKVGTSNLLAGIAGYGMALLVCPWWPTGLGIFGAIVALLQAACVMMLLRWFRHPAPEKPSIFLWVAGTLAIPASVLYLPYCARELPVFAGGVTPGRIAAFFLSTGTILLPVMWSAIVFWPASVRRLFRQKQFGPEAALLLLITCAIAMSVRTLFSGTLSQLSLVTVAAYPVWFLVAPLLLERFLRGLENYPLKTASAPVILLLAGYTILRFGAAVMTERPSRYSSVQTSAGTIRLLDRSTSSEVYQYVLQHTNNADGVVDVAYGGVVNFAARRQSPIYSTQFSALAPARRYLDADLARISARPATIVIAPQAEDFQATYGMCAETGCTFPSLVWRSSRLACEPGRKFPVLEYIKQHYTPVAHFGDKVIYRLGPTLRASS